LVWVLEPPATDADSASAGGAPVPNETSGGDSASEAAAIPVRAATEIGQPPFFIEPEGDLKFEPATTSRGAS